TRIPLEHAGILPVDSPAVLEVLAFDEALNRLDAIDSRKARVLEFWFFAGMTPEEIADAMDIGTSTARRDLDFAKVWVARELTRVEYHAEYVVDRSGRRLLEGRQTSSGRTKIICSQTIFGSV